MENRLKALQVDRRGGALIALAAILAITAAWWALALWPVGTAEPEWLVRTRTACFGSRRGGLPDAGGWILLVGEPLGMLGMLVAIWGRSLQHDVRWLRKRWTRTIIATSVAGAFVIAMTLLGVRTARAWAGMRAVAIGGNGVAHRVNRRAPAIALVDQTGARMSLADLPGAPVLVTVAYGHCATVCPSIINDLHAARRTLGRSDVPLVVVTLDPWRDTPERLPTLARHWQLQPGDRVLSGSGADVSVVLDELGIGRRRNDITGDVEHATTVLILDRGSIAWRVDGGALAVGELLRR